MPIIKKAPPAAEPVSLAEARQQCRLDDDLTDDDGYITGILIPAARQYCEEHTGRPLIAQGFSYVGRFAPVIELLPQLLSVTSVTYIDPAGDQQTVDPATYYADTASIVGSVAALEPWPTVQAIHPVHPQPVLIEFRAGWPDAAAVPASIKLAMLLLIGHWFDNRDAVITGTISTEIGYSVGQLLQPHRLVSL